MGIESDIIRQQRVRNKNNDFSSDISYNKRTEKQQIEEIMDDKELGYFLMNNALAYLFSSCI